MTQGTQYDLDTEIRTLKRLATRLDALFTIPRTRITVGLDNLLGLLPVIGDIAALAPAVYLVWRGYKLGASPGALIIMAGNLALDLVIGLVPIIGDGFDVLYNANLRNVAILERNLNRRAARARSITPVQLKP